MNNADLARAVTARLDDLPEGSRNSARAVLGKNPADWSVHEVEHMRKTLEWFERLAAAAPTIAAEE